MDDARFIRMAGLWCLVGGVIAAVGAVITATLPSAVPLTALSSPYTPSVFRLTEVIWTISHLLMLIGTIGFARSGTVGPSRLGRIGLWIALIGMALIVPSELGFAFFATATMDSPPATFLSSAIGMATTVAALGFLLAGIAVLHARRWQGWHRFIPLLCGLIVFVALVPTLILQPDLFLWPVAAWSASFVPLGLVLSRQHVTERVASFSTATA